MHCVLHYHLLSLIIILPLSLSLSLSLSLLEYLALGCPSVEVWERTARLVWPPPWQIWNSHVPRPSPGLFQILQYTVQWITHKTYRDPFWSVFFQIILFGKRYKLRTPAHQWPLLISYPPHQWPCNPSWPMHILLMDSPPFPVVVPSPRSCHQDIPVHKQGKKTLLETYPSTYLSINKVRKLSPKHIHQHTCP